jgi:hypothetical protein
LHRLPSATSLALHRGTITMTIMQNFTTRELIEAVLGLFVILLGAIALLSIGGF